MEIKKKKGLRVNIFNSPLWIYRFGRRFMRERRLRGLNEYLNFLLNNCIISPTAKIDKGVILKHKGLGIVIGGDTEIKTETRISHNVTIGIKDGKCPKIGRNVRIFTNSTVVGGITIGDNAVIGANSFVNSDIPQNEVWAGVPACRIKKNSQGGKK